MNVKSEALPFMPTVHQLADVIWPAAGSRGHYLILYHLYTLSNRVDCEYHTALIPKQNGETRELRVPSMLLKTVQKRILHNILYCLPVSQYAAAYKPGVGLRSAAEPHVGQRVLLKLDIKDFFQSITFQTVLKSVFGEPEFSRPVGVMLTNLCCSCGTLPQGAPTSPAVSNLVMRSFDKYIGAMCERQGIHYTRYSDDMSFSGDFSPNHIITEVRKFLDAMGFKLNEEKTRVILQNQRQAVTGIIVNEKVQLSSEYRRAIRQEVYYCGKYGVRSHIIRTGNTRFIARDKRARDGHRVYQKAFLKHLLGKISYALYINDKDEEMQRYRCIVSSLLNQRHINTPDDMI